MAATPALRYRFADYESTRLRVAAADASQTNDEGQRTKVGIEGTESRECIERL